MAVLFLAAAGVYLVRSWVLSPIAKLQTAAEHHADGDLQYRIDIRRDDELGTLSREINTMAASLIEIQRRLVEQERLAAIGEVTSSVAHNIRNPLAGIRASAQSSLGELADDSPLKDPLIQIIETVDSLNRWLRELLLVSKPIELQRESVHLVELVERVLAVSQTSAQRRQIRFVLSQSPQTLEAAIDAPRVEQALLVIIDNAVEASPTGAEIRIEFSPASDPAMAEIRVIDAGTGIDPKILQQIGSAYFSTKPGGTGIGLHLARRTIQAHGGSLEFANNPTAGTTVTIRLPVAEPVPKAEA